MKIEVIINDITKLDSDVEAIVNAANSSLLGGGGVDGAIHKAAGPLLYEECKTLHGCNPGDAKVTKAYRLKQKYIIHTVGPMYYYDDNPSKTLRSCYEKCLKVADELNVKKIAFPSISTGVYRYPVEEAAMIAMDVFKTYKAKSIECVIMCVFNKETYDAYLDALNPKHIWHNT